MVVVGFLYSCRVLKSPWVFDCVQMEVLSGVAVRESMVVMREWRR
jgi:hypothetical protein